VTDAPPPLPRFPAGDGLRARFPADLAADAAAIAAVANASLAAAGELARENAADMAVGLTHRTHGDSRTDLVLVERTGDAVAYVDVEWRDHASGALELQISMSCLPEPDLAGVAARLLDWAVARGRQLATGQPPEQARWFAAWCSDGETWTRDALTTAGFAPERHFKLLVRPRLDDLAPPPPLPAGLEVKPAEPAHRRGVWEADVEAFRDHWGTPDTSEAAFERFVQESAQRLDLWQVAWAGDEVAGHVLVAVDEDENAALGVSRGWLESVAVRRPWRRRGLATALVVRALHALRDAGYESAVLGVDVANPQDALDLYRRVGFEIASSATAYRRPFDP
jgi:mycothiol synthase